MACTDREEPSDPDPPAADADTASPSGLRVGVVLEADGAPGTGGLADLEGRLESFAEERAGDVAALRTVVPDDPTFAADVGYALALDGYDLVCLLGAQPVAAVADLADRFPTTRFCALGDDRDGRPQNLDLIDLAHEQLGHALGVAADEFAGEDRTAVIVADDAGGRDRRRDGSLAALAGQGATVLSLPRDDEGGTDVAALQDALEATVGDGAFGAFILDGPSELMTPALAALPEAALLVSEGVAEDVVPDLSFSVDLATVLARALDRLLDDDALLSPLLGFDDGAVGFTLREDAEEVAATLEDVVGSLISGDRDPLVPLDQSPPEERGDVGDVDGVEP